MTNDHMRAIGIVPKKRLWSFTETQVYLNVGKNLLTDLVDDGKINCYRLSSRKMFRLEDLDKFIEELPEYQRYQPSRKERNVSITLRHFGE